MDNILCPRCPVCGKPPQLAVSTRQAFCGNEDCPAFTWDMSIDRSENLNNVNFIDLQIKPRNPQ